MSIDTAAGATIYIGPANTTAVSQSDFEALSYVTIGEVENGGDFGDAYNEVTFTDLSSRRVRKLKGSKNAGNMSLTIGQDTTDSGQTDLSAALDSDSDYAFKVVLDDGAVSGTTYYFRGKVMSTRTSIGDAENVVRLNAEIGINSAIVKIDAV